MLGGVVIYKRLIIVGNGFDLFHGINSRYYDFQNFVYENASRDFIDSIEKYIPPEDLWYQFEEALGHLDCEELRDNHSDSLVSYGADNWSDAYHHEYQYFVDADLAFAKDIPQYLNKWIDDIDTDVDRRLNNFYLSPNSLYLSFNYTDTLEHVYGIARNQILYIHGKAGENSNLIAGHGNKSLFQKNDIPDNLSEEEYEEFMSNMDFGDVRENEAEDIIKGYFRTTYKDVERLISLNEGFFCSLGCIQEVFVLGHSLSDVDMPYFYTIKNIVPFNCQWTVSYYGGAERVHHQQQLLHLGISPMKINFIDLQQWTRKKYMK
ncbi:bacteriophage abortive infection AbiH family protein [Aminipila sp.]|uniref:bacteriophage abortive infection AbiH family protein n=1 Tax=Aminipila sp. TaxID=2060095 RepID=UPI002896B465|nr:bacteriophage abortive infection AbiH family protein [Aminipila sp.]